MKTRSLVVERVMERSGSSSQVGQVVLFWARRESSGRVGRVLEVRRRACWSGWRTRFEGERKLKRETMDRGGAEVLRMINHPPPKNCGQIGPHVACGSDVFCDKLNGTVSILRGQF